MKHDVEKLRRFIQFVEQQDPEDAYPVMINNWLTESAFYIDQEELQYYMNLIPMIQERKKKTALQERKRVNETVGKRENYEKTFK